MSDSLERRLYGAWLISIISAIVALYLGQVQELPTSALTWYARTMMFPLVLLLGMALFQRDIGIRRVVLSLATMGGVVSLYHVLVYNHVVPVIRSCKLIRCDVQSLSNNGVASGTDAILAHPIFSLVSFVLIIILLFRGTPKHL